MKVFRLLFLFVAVSMAFVACEKDEDEVASVSGNKYQTTYAKVVGTIVGEGSVTFEYKNKS